MYGNTTYTNIYHQVTTTEALSPLQESYIFVSVFLLYGNTITKTNNTKHFSRPTNFSFFLLRKNTVKEVVDVEFVEVKNELIAGPVEVAIVGVRK